MKQQSSNLLVLLLFNHLKHRTEGTNSIKTIEPATISQAVMVLSCLLLINIFTMQRENGQLDKVKTLFHLYV